MTLAIYRTASVFIRQLPAHWNKPTLPNIVMSAFSRALAKSKRHRGEQQSSSIDPSSVSEAEVIRLTDILRENLAAKTKRGSTQRRTIEIAFRNIDRDRSDTINSDEFATAVYPFLQGIKKHFVQALFERFDSDGSGELSVGEFSGCYSKKISTKAQREQTYTRKKRGTKNMTKK